MSLADLKKKKGGVSLLQQKIEEMKNKKGSGSSDVDYWKLSVDAAQSGVAEIRLLPAHPDEDFPFVKVEEYFIGVWNEEEQKKKWYINRSLKNIGEKDPVDEEFWELMNSDRKEEAKRLRASTNYICWIYVLSDKHSPQNEGKVFKTKLSPSIWAMIEKKVNPDEEAIEDGAVPCDVFDLWEGATLKLRSKLDKNNMRTYENSVWLESGPLFRDDEKLEEIYSQVKGLKDEVDRNNKIYSDKEGFKTYERLEARLEEVLGGPLAKNEKVDKKSNLADEIAKNESVAKPAAKKDEPKPVPKTEEPKHDSLDSDPDLDDLLNELE